MVQGKEKSMAEKRQILIELRKGSPIRRISRELRVHRDIIRSLIEIGTKEGWMDPSSSIPSEGDIAQILKSNREPVHKLDQHLEKIKEWKTEGYTGVVVQRLLKDQYLCRIEIGTLRRYINRHCQKIPDPVMIRTTIPGKVMEVDFGFLGYLWDESAKKSRKAWVFSARLCHSRKAYRRIVTKQDTSTFLMCHVYAFEHFNGVPEQVVIDNLKAAVIKNTVDNDLLNRAYQDLAEYYDFMISPCLLRTSEHKGGVENDMKYVKRNFWPQIREKLKTKKQLSFQEAQEALEKWDEEIACTREISGIRRSPNEIYLSEERRQLKPLPKIRWELITWIQCTVGRDWRIMYEGSYYSVPYMMIGQTVQCRITHQFVEVYFDHQPIAKHPRATFKGIYQRNSNHAPPFKEAVLNCTRDGLLLNAKEIGEHVYEFCQKMFSECHIDKLRPVRRLLFLATSYPKMENLVLLDHWGSADSKTK
jgi:transposase